MKKICIFITATNYYFPLGLRFMNRWSHLYTGELETEFHFYSEVDPSEYIDSNKINVVYEYMSTKNWSEADVSRIYEIAKLDNHETDYIYVFDADTNISGNFNEDLFIGDLVGFKHQFGAKLFDQNKLSACWIPATDNDIWYQTCLIGGNKKEMLDMCQATLPWINQDNIIGYTPQWIAEKYFNKYLFYKKPSRVIDVNSVPFLMSDKGSDSTFIMGIDAKPFHQISEDEYNQILLSIKENKDYLWDIKDFKFVAYKK